MWATMHSVGSCASARFNGREGLPPPPGVESIKEKTRAGVVLHRTDMIKKKCHTDVECVG